jgi:amino acid adenylation domain-containing protein
VAAWERGRLAGERFAARLAWWERQLAGAPLLQVPTDRPRPAERSPRGRTALLEIPSDLVAAVAALARRERATPFTILLAAFQAQLFRTTGEEDLALGSALAQRGRAELEPLAGLLLETVVLRTAVAGELTFRELLGRARRTVLDAFRHADVPFEKVVDRLRPERGLGHNPLFEVSFALQPDLPDRLELPGLVLTAQGSETGTARFELGLSVREASGRLTAALEHSADLFDAPTAVRMLRGFVRLLSGAVAAPDARLDALPLLDEAERFQLLFEWNTEGNDVPSGPAVSGRCLHEAFAAQAARTPDATAVVCGEESLTYRELAGRARRLARHLLGLGAGSGARVGLWAERSAGTIVGILAALEAGAAWVPLDPAYPAERLAHMARDSGLAVLLAPEGTLEGLPELGLDLEGLPGLGLERISPGGFRAASPAAAPSSLAWPRSPAYVLYTSGSTGRPKGVCCIHAGVLNLVRDMELRHPLRPGAACALFGSFSFDVSVYEIFTALLAGGRLEVVPDRVRADGRALAGWLAERAIESTYLPPTLLGDLARELEHTPVPLRRLLVGVEPIPEPLLAALIDRVPGLRIFNGYGPTEATVYVTLYEVGSRPVRDRSTPVGRPVRGARIYLLDRGLEPVPLGVPGELWAAGAGLAQGYLGKPDLTAEKFLPDPFGAAAGERMYRTGDLARFLPEGDVEFLGRLDFQVKIRGMRVELGEIEAALRAHPAVAEAVVTAREAATGGRRLAAYLIPAEGAADGDLGAGELRRYLAGRLPEVMIPGTFVTLAALPLTRNGKIDRAALPAPGAERPDLENAYVAPRTPEERAVGAVWQAVLGQERIGIYDNFFELGGNSLLLVQVEGKLREALGRDIPIAEMYRSPTIYGLAQALSDQDKPAQERLTHPEKPAEERAAGGVVDRQRQFMEDQKRRRAEQRRSGR